MGRSVAGTQRNYTLAYVFPDVLQSLMKTYCPLSTEVSLSLPLFVLRSFTEHFPFLYLKNILDNKIVF